MNNAHRLESGGKIRGVPDLAGKSVLVTGASSGIGLEACVQLAAMGADVTMVARDRAKGESVRADVQKRAGDALQKTVGGRVQPPTLLLCDFASQPSIRALANEYRRTHSRLDILPKRISPRTVFARRTRLCATPASSTGIKSDTSATPLSDRNLVSSTLVSGR